MGAFHNGKRIGELETPIANFGWKQTGSANTSNRAGLDQWTLRIGDTAPLLEGSIAFASHSTAMDERRGSVVRRLHESGPIRVRCGMVKPYAKNSDNP